MNGLAKRLVMFTILGGLSVVCMAIASGDAAAVARMEGEMVPGWCFESKPDVSDDGVHQAQKDAHGTGWDDECSKALATFDIPIRPPGPPTDLAATVVDDHIILVWKPPLDDGGSKIESYTIQRSSSRDGSVGLTKVSDVQTYEDSTVVEDIEYTYRVNAINVAGHGEMSMPITVKLESRLGPAAVTPGWLVLVTITILALLKLLALTLTESGRFRLTLLLVPMIIRGQHVLDHETRHSLHAVIVERPGLHYSALREEFGLSNGETAYHLFMLERENLVTSVRDGRLRRFYSVDFDLPKDCDKSPQELRRKMVKLVRRRPGINQMEIMEELGMDRDCASYYLRNLVKEGRLEDGKDGRYTLYHVR